MNEDLQSVWAERRVFIGEVLFCAAYGLALIIRLSYWSANKSIFVFTDAGAWLNTFKIIAIILLGLKYFFTQRMRPVMRIIGILIIILMWITFNTSANYTVLATALFIVCGQNVRVKSLAKIQFAVCILMTLTNIVLVYTGNIKHYIFYRGDLTRYSLGYTNPNILGMVIFAICLSWCVLTWGKKLYMDFSVIAIGIFICCFVANSRTYMFALCLLAVFVFIQHFIKNKRVIKICVAGLTVIVALVVLFSFFCMLFYPEDNALFSKINSALSNRPMLSNLFYEAYGLNIFGKNFSGLSSLWEGYSFLVDNLFCNILLRFGIIAALLFLVGAAAFYRDALKQMQWSILLTGMSLWLITGLAETYGMMFEINFFLIAISGSVFKEPSEKSEDLPEQDEVTYQ